jgi:hypothetical protein
MALGRESACLLCDMRNAPVVFKKLDPPRLLL